MITTASNHYDEHLKRYKASILAGIEEVRDYCESNEQLDEYTYILLWRPVEWIIEYCALVDYKEYRGVKNAAAPGVRSCRKRYHDEVCRSSLFLSLSRFKYSTSAMQADSRIAANAEPSSPKAAE